MNGQSSSPEHAFFSIGQSPQDFLFPCYGIRDSGGECVNGQPSLPEDAFFSIGQLPQDFLFPCYVQLFRNRS